MTSLWRTKEYDCNAPVHAHMNVLPPVEAQYDPVSLPPEVSNMDTVKLNETRFYKLGDEFFPSITSVLKATDLEGQKGLARWRKAIGEEKAAAITNAASARGTRWHKFCELYLMGQVPGWSYVTTPEDRRMAIHITHMLNENVKRVLANEVSVVSRRYGIAGRLDLAAELSNGKCAIIDFKTGKKKKTGNRLDQAALQGAFYADALTESLPMGIIDTVVVAQLTPSSLYWQETPAAEWREKLQAKIAQYAEIVNKELSK